MMATTKPPSVKEKIHVMATDVPTAIGVSIWQARDKKYAYDSCTG